MQVIQDNIWLCTDCTHAAVNNDYSSLDYDYSPDERELRDLKEQQIREGLSRLGPNLVSDFDSQTESGLRSFSDRICEACGTSLAGYRARFAILG